MDKYLTETLEIADLVLADRESGFLRFTGDRPVVISGNTAVEIRCPFSYKGTLTAKDLKLLRPHLKWAMDLEFDEYYVRLETEFEYVSLFDRKPDTGIHSVEKYYNNIGPKFYEEEIPVGVLWGDYHRRFGGETFVFELFDLPYRLAEYGGIQLGEKVPVAFYWSYIENGMTVPMLEVWFGFCRLLVVGI